MSTIEQLEQRRLLATISGTVFYDLNGNGINDGDNGAFNNTQTVFLDQNNNGVVDAGEAHQSVDQFGHYDFINLAAGTYRVALIPDSGYLRSTSQASVPVAVADMQDASGPDFGVTQRASLGGTTFNDANVNGLPDTGEPGVAKTIVFLDANGNGKVDSTTSTISSSDVPQIAPGISSVASDLTVSGLTGLITDVNVTINLASPNDNDPDIFLESPQGLRVELVSPIDTANNASQSNFTKTTFDDQASQAIGAGSGPFSGSFQTSGSLRGLGLDLFNNLSPNGTWRLIVEDTAGDNTARLKNWAITLTTGDPITKTDFGGAYGFSVAPGTYRVGAGKKTFTISAPGGKKHEFAVTVNATDTRQDLNFGMEEVGSDNSTIQFSPAFDLSKGTSDSPFSVVTGDFNKDGKLDIAAANNGSNDVGIYLGKGTGNFLAPVFYHSGEVPRAMASGDFNHDGNIDLVIANHDDKNVGVLLGNGNGTFQTVRTFNTSNEEPWSVAVGDFNGDGKQDLAVAIQDMPPKIDIFLGKGNGNFLAPIPIAAANEPTSVQTADVNRDGKLDLIVTNNTDNKVSVFIGKGNGNFTLAHNISVGHRPLSVAIADLNGDNKLDLIVTDTDDDMIEVMLGKGNGQFLSAVEYNTDDTPASVKVADLNADGKPDVIVANQSDGGSDISGSVQVFLGVGDGTLIAPFGYTTHTSPVDVAFGDFNRDGKLDMAVANFNSDDVSVLLNKTAPLFP